MRKGRSGQAATVDVVAEGAFLGIEEYAERKIGSLLRLTHEPVLAVSADGVMAADRAIDANVELVVSILEIG